MRPKGFRSWQEYFDRHVAECENCAPYFQGEGQMSAEGTEIAVDDLPHEIGIPVHRAGPVVENGRCDGCGSIVGEMINVWARPTSEVEFRALVGRARRRHGSRIDAFRDFLTKHPYLGASHPTGRAIMSAVTKIEPVTVDGSWFRCIRERDGKPPKQDDFRAPFEEQQWPIHEGRYNHAGQAHWYLADNERTSISEVLDFAAGIVWTQEFRIEPCTRILDLSTSIEDEYSPLGGRSIEVALALVMMGVLDGYVDRKQAWKPGYLVPRFVMDAAKRAGFEGIRYRSARDMHGENIVLFRRDWPAECAGDPQRHEQEETPDFEVMR